MRKANKIEPSLLKWKVFGILVYHFSKSVEHMFLWVYNIIYF